MRQTMKSIVLVALVLLSFAPAARAQEEPPSDTVVGAPIVVNPEAKKAFGRLKSPWCPELMLEICPTIQAAYLRDTLNMMANAGVGADSLVAFVVNRYGEQTLAMPKTQGRGLVAWVIPPLGLALGLGIVIIVLRRLRGTDDVPEGGRDLSDEEERRLREAMSQLEKETG